MVSKKQNFSASRKACGPAAAIFSFLAPRQKALINTYGAYRDSEDVPEKQDSEGKSSHAFVPLIITVVIALAGFCTRVFS